MAKTTASTKKSTAKTSPASKRSTKTTPAKPPAQEKTPSRGHVLWKGAIAFGLVHVPVDLYSAARSNTLDLDLLDKRSHEPVGYRRINKVTGKEVTPDNIVKGYEYEKGLYVVLGEEDFRRANPKATQTVDIFSFVDGSEIPFIYYDTPYYLVPTRQGGKVYALLREAMQQAGCIALATVVIQTKQHLAAVIPDGDKLILNTLRYGEEIRSTENFSFPENAALKPAELKMAQQLIESMRGVWQPEDYRDTYRDDVMARIEARVQAGDIHTVAAAAEGEAPRSAEVIDLMSLLKNSLPASKAAAQNTAPSKKAAPRARKQA